MCSNGAAPTKYNSITRGLDRLSDVFSHQSFYTIKQVNKGIRQTLRSDLTLSDIKQVNERDHAGSQMCLHS